MPWKPEPKAEVPGWIISFSDMITLLLAFFVLLQAFAHVPDEGLFFTGQASFKRAIDGLGIPSFLLGEWEKPARDYIQVLHAPAETAEKQMRLTIDQRDEMIRERFSRIMQEMDSETTDNDQQSIAGPQGFDIAFDRSGYEVTDASKRLIVEYADSLARSVNRSDLRGYVIGFAKGQPSQRALLMLSAQRAQSVARVLREQFAAGDGSRHWEVLSWGGGTGVDWAGAIGMNADQASIAIAVMGAK